MNWPLLEEAQVFLENPHSMRNHPRVATEHAKVVIAEVIAQLTAEGVITAARGTVYGEERSVSIGVSRGSTSGPLAFDLPFAPAVVRGDRYRLLHPAARGDALITEAELQEGLKQLLDPRGLATLREAHRAFRAGLWLAAASLLGAASESAWFALARKYLPTGSTNHRLALVGENPSKVMAATQDVIRSQELAPPSTLNDLACTAAHLRDLRNYGMHPAGPHDTDREAAFTQVAVATLMLSTRRYFVRLAEVLDDAGSA